MSVYNFENLKANDLKISLLGINSTKSALYIMKRSFRYWLFIATLGFTVPALVYEVCIAMQGVTIAESIKRTLTSIGTTPSFTDIVNPVANQIAIVFPMILFLSLVWMASYFAIIWSAHDKLSTDASTNSGLRLFIRGLKLAVTKGVGFSLLVFITLVALRGMILIIFIAVSLLLLAPVVLALEKSSVFKSLKNLITIEYAKGATDGRWYILFQLASYTALLIIIVLGLNYAEQVLLNLDFQLPLNRSVFLASILPNSIPNMYILGTILKSAATSMVLCFFAIFTTCYYLQLRVLKEQPTPNF